MVKDELFKNKNDYKTILASLKDEITDFTERVGKDRSRQTLNKMIAVQMHLKNYILYKYNSKDIYIQELNENFIQGYYEYLIYKVHLNSSTASVYCASLKKVVMKAYNDGYLKNNPFRKFKVISQIKPREFLTENEIQILMNYANTSKSKNKRIVHIFLFCCREYL